MVGNATFHLGAKLRKFEIQRHAGYLGQSYSIRDTVDPQEDTERLSANDCSSDVLIHRERLACGRPGCLDLLSRLWPDLRPRILAHTLTLH